MFPVLQDKLTGERKSVIFIGLRIKINNTKFLREMNIEV